MEQIYIYISIIGKKFVGKKRKFVYYISPEMITSRERLMISMHVAVLYVKDFQEFYSV
jgi:hypothetical protein